MKKVIFIGPANVGKSSLRLFYFEQTSPETLIKNPLFPTRGVNHITYDHVFSVPKESNLIKGHIISEKLPLKVNVMDCSGQEFNTWFEKDSSYLFYSADIIFFVFDASQWLDDMERVKIKNQLLKIYEKRAKLSPDSHLYVIGHKFDLIPKDYPRRNDLSKIIKKELKEHVYLKEESYHDFNVYMSSLIEMQRDTLLTMATLIATINS